MFFQYLLAEILIQACTWIPVGKVFSTPGITHNTAVDFISLPVSQGFVPRQVLAGLLPGFVFEAFVRCPWSVGRVVEVDIIYATGLCKCITIHFGMMSSRVAGRYHTILSVFQL